jgi:predicted transcriptional regulator
MKTVVLDVRSFAKSLDDVKRSLKSGKAQPHARISFATPELLWETMTAKRWELVKALCGKGPVTFRKAAALVKRDVKAVHGDLTALIRAGIVLREAEGVVFPYDTIKIEYELRATA